MLLQFGRRAALTAHIPTGLPIFESSRKPKAWFDYPPYADARELSPRTPYLGSVARHFTEMPDLSSWFVNAAPLIAV
jgi:hypothetical protein